MNVTLRRMTLADSHRIVKWRNHPDVRKWFFDPKPITLSWQMAWFRDYQKRCPKQEVRYIILANSRPVGSCGITNIDHGIGYVTIYIANPGHRRQGVAANAMALLIGRCECELGVKCLRAEIMPDNIVSQKFFESCGFGLSAGGRPEVVTMEKHLLQWGWAH